MRILTFLSFFIICVSSYAQNKINLEQVASGLSIPVDIVFDPQNNMYVVEKGGKIKRINLNSNIHEDVLNLTDRVNSGANERGLLGMVFHPEYLTNGYVFVNYTGNGGHTRISRFKRTNGNAFGIDSASEKILMTILQPYNNHNAGDLNFGSDGYLYIAMGDGGSGGDPLNKSQNPKDKLGKMLRIDINTETDEYLIPSDNPYANAKDTLKEIWAMGLRNPWRFSFDQLTQDLWIADVGQNRWEELNFTPASSNGGENYGWRCYEADQKYDFSDCNDSTVFTFPIHKYQTSSGGEGCSITGGFVSRDTTQKTLYGKYIYGDYCTGNIWYIYKNENGSYVNEKIYKLSTQELSSFGQDNAGVIYATAIGDGVIYKISEKCSLLASGQVLKDASCTEIANGSSIITVTGSQNYSISLNGATDFNLDSLAAGSYSFQVTDLDNACTAIGNFTIGIKDSLMLSVSSNEFIVCEGITITPLEFDLDIDSIHYYLNNELINKDTSFRLELEQEGIYSFIIFKDGCDFIYNDFVTLDIVDDLIQPEITISNDTLYFSGNFETYHIYRNDSLILISNEDFIVINLEEDAVYYVVGLDQNRLCFSDPSDPLIISSIKDADFTAIKFFPNPASFDLHFTKGKKIDEIIIFNATGQRLMTFYNVADSIDLTSLPLGLYTIHMKVNKINKSGLLKVIK